MLMTLTPSQIRFMQDSINWKFRRSKGVNETIDDILAGRTSVEQLPRMVVAEKDGKYYSYDNRRLYMYRVLEKMGRLKTVEVNKRSFIQTGQFTTKNDGYSIEMRGGHTRPHTFNSLLYTPRSEISTCSNNLIANDLVPETRFSAISTKDKQTRFGGSLLFSLGAKSRTESDFRSKTNELSFGSSLFDNYSLEEIRQAKLDNLSSSPWSTLLHTNVGSTDTVGEINLNRKRKESGTEQNFSRQKQDEVHNDTDLKMTMKCGKATNTVAFGDVTCKQQETTEHGDEHEVRTTQKKTKLQKKRGPANTYANKFGNVPVGKMVRVTIKYNLRSRKHTMKKNMLAKINQNKQDEPLAKKRKTRNPTPIYV